MKIIAFWLICFAALTGLAGCGNGNFNSKDIVGPAGPAGLNFRKAYDPAAKYAATDVVTFAGSSYVSLGSSSGVAPVGMADSSNEWSVLAQGGKDGAAGAAGPAGATGPQGLPGVPGLPGAQGLPGAAGAAGAVGPAGAMGPQGLPGAQGVAGVAGAAGAMGPVGPAGPAGVAGAVGPVGPAGAVGAQGPAGLNGAQGVAGPVGAVGPIGAAGLAGATGAAGAAGPVGATGAVGPMGMKGDVGPAGPAGVAGVAGPQGDAGPAGVAGPAGAKGDMGPMGPQGLPGPAGVAPIGTVASYLQGKNYALLGDSLTLIGNWQPVVSARTGMTLVNQDGRGGRPFSAAFECYGQPLPGDAIGRFTAAAPVPNNGTCRDVNKQTLDGASLADTMANVDVMVILLGTNDALQNVPLGQLGDANNANSFYGNMHWVVESLRKAKPQLRVIMVTLGFDAYVDGSVLGRYRDATVALARSMGVPVVDMLATGGVAMDNWQGMLVDGVHHQGWYDTDYFGPIVANGIIQSF